MSKLDKKHKIVKILVPSDIHKISYIIWSILENLSDIREENKTLCLAFCKWAGLTRLSIHFLAFKYFQLQDALVRGHARVFTDA